MATGSSSRRHRSGRALAKGMHPENARRLSSLADHSPCSKRGNRGIRCASQWEASSSPRARACACDTFSGIRCQGPGLLRGGQAAGSNRKHAEPGRPRLHCRSHARLDDSDAEAGGEIRALHHRCRKSGEFPDLTLPRKVLPTFKGFPITRPSIGRLLGDNGRPVVSGLSAISVPVGRAPRLSIVGPGTVESHRSRLNVRAATHPTRLGRMRNEREYKRQSSMCKRGR